MEQMYRFLLNLGVEPKKAKEAIKTLEEIVTKATFESASECGTVTFNVTRDGIVATYERLKVTFGKDGITVSPVEGCPCWEEGEIHFMRFLDEQGVSIISIPQPPSEN